MIVLWSVMGLSTLAMVELLHSSHPALYTFFAFVYGINLGIAIQRKAGPK